MPLPRKLSRLRLEEPDSLFESVRAESVTVFAFDGNLYDHLTVHNHGHSILGNAGTMGKLAIHLKWRRKCTSPGTRTGSCKPLLMLICFRSANHDRSRLPSGEKAENTPPTSESYGEGDEQRSTHSRSETLASPAGFRQRQADWFKPGLYFQVWAPDTDLHQKEFVLLDSQNVGGPALLVCRHRTEDCSNNKGSYWRNHIQLSNYGKSHKPSNRSDNRKEVFMDAGEDQIPENTWIELDHVHNIPFGRYDCFYNGMLDLDSLDNLRGYFVEWLTYIWRLRRPISEARDSPKR